jgi:hypothetical protein
MGLKKEVKRLLKLGQKAAKALGREGRTRVEEVLATAIGTLEGELRRNDGPKPKKASAEGARKRSGRPAPGSPAIRVPVKKQEPRAARRTAPPGRRPAAQGRRAPSPGSRSTSGQAPSSNEPRGAPSA